jgi:polysaccharide export outer membrane protein
MVLAMAVLTAVIGCETSQVKVPSEPPPEHTEAITLREGDTLKISFPGAPNLDTTQQIRRDGRISLFLAGEMTAAGVTPAELEKKILELYSSQLASKEVTVTVLSSSIPVFVTGAVLRPGKILSDHPITALEAIMEAGGFDYTKANLSAVVVIRQEEGKAKNYTLNMKLVLQGKQSVPFYLKPSDIVYVPERFVWF